jgi:hypothetical protein
MSLYFECNLNGKQVKVEDSDKEPARVKTFVGSRKTFATPAFVRGTKQEVSTFLLNNQDRTFTGDGATIHYACYAYSPRNTRQRATGPINANVVPTEVMAGAPEVILFLAEQVKEAVLEAFDAHAVELAVSTHKDDLLQVGGAKQTETKHLIFNDLVPAVWG